MSMDEPAVGHDVKDTDMSEASVDDPDLALGEIVFLYVLFIQKACAQAYYIDIEVSCGFICVPLDTEVS